MAYQTILFDRSEGVGTVTLNRPDQLNAFTPQMLQELMDVFKGMERDPDVRVIVITGAGKAFCGGEDFKARAEAEVEVQPPPPPSNNLYGNTTQAGPYNPGYSNSYAPAPTPTSEAASYSPLNPGPPPSINSNVEESISPFDNPFNPRPAPAPNTPPSGASGPNTSSYVPSVAPQPTNVPRPISMAEQIRRAYNPLIRQIRSIEKPVIAAINGVAAGTGLGLALACDIRYASERARFVEVSVRVGLLPGSGNGFFLPRLIGISRALELAFSGDEMSAADAERVGLISRVVQSEQLIEQTRKLAVRLAKGPTRAIGLTKSMMYGSANLNLEQALELEARLTDDATRSEDYKEGLRAFLEKRPPKYRGQ